MSRRIPAVSPLFLREEALRDGLQALILAERALIGDLAARSDRAGTGHGDAAPSLSPAQIRVVFLVGQADPMPLSDALAQLGVTKQSLWRLTRPLFDRGLMSKRASPSDGRERLLSLTPAGRALEQSLFATARRRLAEAYKRSGAEAVDGFITVTRAMVS